MGRPRKYDEAFRQAALERMKAGQDIRALARELGVNYTQLYRWRNEALGRRPVPRPASWAPEERGAATPAYRGLGTPGGATGVGTGFFQRCLAAHRGKSPEAGTEFRQAVYEQIRHVDGQQGELTIERMCILAAVSRAGYYRFCTPKPDPDEEQSRLRDAIQQVAIESRQYGYRRITSALRAQGWEVNHKRVARLMREDGLLAIRKRRFVPQTTDSGHDFEVALNVARQLIPTAVNQLWVADIGSVRTHSPAYKRPGDTLFADRLTS